MAFKGPSYGLSAELKLKSEAKYDPEEAKKCLKWINQVTSAGLDSCKCKTDDEFAEQLKDGQALCKLINAIAPGSVKKINTMSATFKQRENIEMYLQGCTNFGLIESDLFQVNDLYEMKNVYMVIDNCYSLSGTAQKKGWKGPSLGVKHASENPREFDEATLNAGKTHISLQYGSNQGASQAGMSYGSNRPLNPTEFVKHDLTPKVRNLCLYQILMLVLRTQDCQSCKLVPKRAPQWRATWRLGRRDRSWLPSSSTTTLSRTGPDTR